MGLAYFEGKISKNRLLYKKKAVGLAFLALCYAAFFIFFEFYFWFFVFSWKITCISLHQGEIDEDESRNL